MRPGKKRIDLDTERLKKGAILVVKVPPFYDKEYLYEISGSGGKVVRANLYHSPRVKKEWSMDDLALLFGNGMVRFAEEADLASREQAPTPSDQAPDQP
jgi:hypothetical protein